MAVTPIIDGSLNTENEELIAGVFVKVRQRAYVAGEEATLAGMSLEKGDTLPEDSDFEIVAPSIRHHSQHGRIAVVKAVSIQSE